MRPSKHAFWPRTKDLNVSPPWVKRRSGLLLQVASSDGGLPFGLPCRTVVALVALPATLPLSRPEAFSLRLSVIQF